MSFKSVLSSVGHGLKVFFTGAVKVATAAEPFIAAVFPGVAPLFIAITTAVGNAEGNAIAAGSQEGTGAQKLAMVLASVEKDFAAYEAANGITAPHSQEQIAAAVNGIVAFLNALQAPTTP